MNSNYYTSQLQLEFLPYDVLFLIFDEMEIKDIVELSMTNKRMNEAVKAYDINRRCYRGALKISRESDKKYMYVLREYDPDTNYCLLIEDGIQTNFKGETMTVKPNLHFILDTIRSSVKGEYGFPEKLPTKIGIETEDLYDIYLDNLAKYAYERLRYIDKKGLINYKKIFANSYFDFDYYLQFVHSLVDYDYDKLKRDYPALKYFEKLERNLYKLSDLMYDKAIRMLVSDFYPDILSPSRIKRRKDKPTMVYRDINKENILYLKHLYTDNYCRLGERDKRILLRIFRDIMNDDNIKYSNKHVLLNVRGL